MAFKMRGAPFPKAAFKDAGHGGDAFHTHETPKDKAKRDLDMMQAGSRFDESGKRKTGEARKIAKMTRKFTGLDQQKYDREAKREKKSFRGKSGQEGLDKLRTKLQKKAKRKRGTKKAIGKITKAIGKVVGVINPFDAQSKTARGARKTSARVSGNRSGAGSGCEKTGSCGAFD